MLNGGVLKGLATIVAVCALTVVRAAPVPRVELEMSSTNVIVCETVTARINILLPPLDAPYDNHPPFVNERAPHLIADFLQDDWTAKSKCASTSSIWSKLSSLISKGDVPSFTINEYRSNNFFDPMGNMFGGIGSMFSPRFYLFALPFERVEDNGVKLWRFTIDGVKIRTEAPGVVELGPVIVDVPLIVGVDAKGQPNFKRQRITSRTVQIKVSDPPASGRPSSYLGTIGRNLAVDASLDTNVCKVGDPIVLIIDVSGNIDLSRAHPIRLTSAMTDGAFRVDDKSAQTETLNSSRRLKYRVRPLKAGTLEFPPLAFSYYDLDSRSYKTVRTSPIPVMVQPAMQAALVGEFNSHQDDSLPMPDGVSLSGVGATSQPLLPHLPWIIALLILPPLAALAKRILPRLFSRISSYNENNRKASALSRCLKAFNGKNVVKKELAIRRYFEIRFGVNGAAVTSADAEKLMHDDCVDEDSVKRVTGTLREIEAKNFSHHSSASSDLALIILLTVGASILTIPCVAANAFHNAREFVWERAASMVSRASSETDFKKTALVYDSLVMDGAANPILFTNLGSVYLLAGEPSNALYAYARAERYGGATPATDRGIRAAYARLHGNASAEVPLIRSLLRPHVKYNVDVRFLIGATAWALFWLLSFLHPGVIRTFMRSFAATVMILAAVSVAVSLSAEFEARAKLSKSHAASASFGNNNFDGRNTLSGSEGVTGKGGEL